MLRKEEFIKAIQAIQEQEKLESQLGELFQAMCPDNYWLSSCTNLIDAFVSVLESEMQDEHQWIQWWLYEDVEHVVSWMEDGQEQSITIKTPEDLYDFLETCHKEKGAE